MLGKHDYRKRYLLSLATGLILWGRHGIISGYFLLIASIDVVVFSNCATINIELDVLAVVGPVLSDTSGLYSCGSVNIFISWYEAICVQP